MATQPSPPPIDNQHEELLEFIVSRCYQFEQECEWSERHGIRLQGPPKCERSSAPAKVLNTPLNRTLPMAGYHKDSWGHININTRECPHCGAVIYGQHEPVSIQVCLSCNNRFFW